MRISHICALLCLVMAAGPVLAQQPNGEHPKFGRYLELQDKTNLRAYTIPILGEINGGMAALVRRGAEEAKAWHPDLVVLEIDSEGGWNDHADVILKALDELSKTALLVAFIQRKALSGGALIALSCDFIVMKPDAVIGSNAGLEGIMPGISYIRERFHLQAEKKGHPVFLAQAMADPGITIREVNLHGERRYLSLEEIIRLRKQNVEVHETGDQPCGPGQFLNVGTSKAYQLGITTGTAETMDEIYLRWTLDVTDRRRVDPSWSETLVSYMSWPVIVLLIGIGLLGIYVEINTPGFGVPGVLGLVCIGTVLFAEHLAGLAEVSEILLIAIGLILLLVEFFVVPGFGWVGISGLICIGIGMVLSFQSFTVPAHEWQVNLMVRNTLMIFGSFTVGVGCIVTLMRFVPGLPVLGHLTLESELKNDDGYVVGEPAAHELKGRQGTSTSILRPTGKVEIDGKLHDVVCDGEFIPAGTRVVVSEVHGNRVVVERLRHGPA